MSRLAYFVGKEFRQLGRDKLALLMLFAMPTIFILIMSLALQDGFAGRKKVELEYALVDQTNSSASRELIELFEDSGLFRRVAAAGTEQSLRERTRDDDVKFLLVIGADFESKVLANVRAVTLELAPGTDAPLALLAESHLRRALARVYLNLSLGPVLPDARLESGADLLAVTSLFTGAADTPRIPSAAQQNVPAWLLFAMFFVAVPVSTVMVAERANGTLARLRTMQLPRYQVFLGKMIPFFVINLAQVAVMFLVGIYILPLFGGERLTLGASPGGLALISAAASLTAVCYALLVAQIVRTNEQATIFCGVCNIIMAAVGGIMVPRFLMPELMQKLGLISPMAWGLEGFLDLLLRGGSIADVVPESTVLVAFALIMLLLAIWLARRQGAI